VTGRPAIKNTAEIADGPGITAAVSPAARRAGKPNRPALGSIERRPARCDSPLRDRARYLMPSDFFKSPHHLSGELSFFCDATYFCTACRSTWGGRRACAVAVVDGVTAIVVRLLLQASRA
jgi:hypothetical protein